MRSPISGTSCASLLRMYSTSSLSKPPRPVPQLPFRIQTQVTASASFSTTSIILSGHSRWSKIKHDKGKADLRRGAEFSKISREIITAAKVDGADSHRLKAALDLGKKAGMSKAAMESAVQRGLGVSREGVELQTVTIEALGPANVSLIVDCVTDNKLRTMQTIKLILKEGGATVTPTAYLFSRKGRIFYSLVPGLPEPQPTLPEVFEETFEKAMDIEGVEDAELVEPGANGEGESGGISVTTVPELANAVLKQLMETMSAKLKIEKIGVEWVGNEDTLVDEGTGQDWEKLGDLISTLEEEDDVQEVYTNIRPPKDA